MLRRLMMAGGGGVVPMLTTWNPGYLSPAAAVAASNTELHASSSATYANSRSLSILSGDVYFSARCERGSSKNFGFGVADASVNLTASGSYVGGGASIGLWQEGRIYAGGSALVSGLAVATMQDIEIAVRTSSRRVWIRRTGSAWIGGGDPVANTTPTYTLGGTGVIHVAGSLDARTGGTANALIRLPTNPVNVTGVAPAGFTVGVS